MLWFILIWLIDLIVLNNLYVFNISKILYSLCLYVLIYIDYCFYIEVVVATIFFTFLGSYFLTRLLFSVYHCYSFIILKILLSLFFSIYLLILAYNWKMFKFFTVLFMLWSTLQQRHIHEQFKENIQETWIIHTKT